MNYPQRLVEIIDTFYASHPHLAKGSDAQRRDLMRMIHEQYEHELPPAQRGRWGNKQRAGLSDVDRSKDGSAYLEDDGTLSVWDVQNGATRERAVNAGDPPSHPHLPAGEATFIRVEPVHHFGTPTPEPPAPPPPSVDLGPILARLDAIERINGRLDRDLHAIHEQIDQLPPPVMPPIPTKAKIRVTYRDVITGREIEGRLE
jgi:hypothetical protein